MVARRARTKTVERKIYFYRSNIGTGKNGKPKLFDPAPIIHHINTLSFHDNSRYLSSSDGSISCCWVENTTPRHKLKLGSVRRSGLPQLEQDGNLSPLDIPEDSGLVEQIHVVFFSNNIVGAEFNFYGPRIHRLAHYFIDKANHLCRNVVFAPLLKQDTAEQLAKITEVRLFRLKIRDSYIKIVEKADRDLGSAFEAAKKVGGAGELEIILKPTAYSRGWLSPKILKTIKKLSLFNDIQSEARQFTIKGLNGETGNIDSIDLLNDQLIAKKKILCVDERSRALDSLSAFAAIEEAYEELKDELIVAAGVE